MKQRSLESSRGFVARPDTDSTSNEMPVVLDGAEDGAEDDAHVDGESNRRFAWIPERPSPL